MINQTRAAALSLGLILTFFLTGVDAREPMPNPAKEAKLKQLNNASVESAFSQLKAVDFLYDEEFLDEGIDRAFMSKKDEGVRFALRQIQSSRSPKDTTKAKDFYIAKRILQRFPDKSQRYLIEAYQAESPEIRKNAICVLSGLPMNATIKGLLLRALDDKSFCEERLPDSVGDPLRVCDALYNEIVSQYGIPNVLRTIGTVHKMDVRDYHIGKLKTLL